MPIEIWLLYVTTVLAFMSTPGPSHLLMLSNSLNHGFRPSLATAAGDLCANALQMLAAGLGLAAILTASQGALTVIKWLGAAYLFWMGVQMVLKGRTQSTGTTREKNSKLGALWLQGFLTSAANPKAVVFFAALFPQFISSEYAFAPQFFLLSLTYIVVDGAFLAAYGAGAGWIGKKLKNRAGALVNTLGGSFMIGAAILLGLKTLRDAR